MWVSDNDKVDAIRRVLAGRSGKGHFLESSGRVDCPECHHPPEGHAKDCQVGIILVSEDYKAAIQSRIGVLERTLINLAVLAGRAEPKPAYCIGQSTSAVERLVHEVDQLRKENSRLSEETWRLRGKIEKMEISARSPKPKPKRKR